MLSDKLNATQYKLNLHRQFSFLLCFAPKEGVDHDTEEENNAFDHRKTKYYPRAYCFNEIWLLDSLF